MWSGEGTLPPGYGATTHPSEEPRLAFYAPATGAPVAAWRRVEHTAMRTSYGPAWVALGPPIRPGGYGDDGYGAAKRPDCAFMLAKRKAAIKEMWRWPLFSERRVHFEKLANIWGKRYDQCKIAEQKAAAAAKQRRAIVSVKAPSVAAEKSAADAPTPDAAALTLPAPAGMSSTTLIIGGVILAVLLGGGYYYYTKNKKRVNRGEA